MGKPDNTQLLIGAGVMAAAYFFIIRPLTKAFGKSDDEIKTDALLDDVNKFFNPNFWRTGGRILTDASAWNLTEKIYDGIGTFYDDEAEITAAFKALRYKNQVSYLAYKYQERFGRDLLTDLKKNLSADELAPIYAYIKTLPLGK
jgi:hypothetical protein